MFKHDNLIIRHRPCLTEHNNFFIMTTWLALAQLELVYCTFIKYGMAIGAVTNSSVSFVLLSLFTNNK